MTPPYDPPQPASPPSGEPASAHAPTLKRSGSQKRQRSKKLEIALTPAQYDEVKTLAASAGMSASDWGFTIIFGSPGPRARRAPHIHAELMARATAALNKLGNNFNQTAHVLNAGGALSIGQKYLDALEDVRLTLRALREAAGYGERHDYQGEPPR